MIAKAKTLASGLKPFHENDLPPVLGRTEAALLPLPQRWLQQWWGYLDIHTRQKWTLLRPLLGGLPERGVRLLDAGCGSGRWTLELAARRPAWTITGLDLDAQAIREATKRKDALQLPNVSFEQASFFEFNPEEPFDVLLSIASAHYLARDGQADALFAKFAEWVVPGGTLLMYGPREPRDIPAAGWLPALSNDWGFPRQYLLDLCRRAGFETDAEGCYGLFPVVGRWSTLAKQTAIATDRNPLTRAAAYPIALALGSVDLDGLVENEPSAAWLLIARRGNA